MAGCQCACMLLGIWILQRQNLLRLGPGGGLGRLPVFGRLEGAAAGVEQVELGDGLTGRAAAIGFFAERNQSGVVAVLQVILEDLAIIIG